MAGATSRATQTILASRGLISFATGSEVVAAAAPSPRSHPSEDRREVGTQATPAHPSAAEILSQPSIMKPLRGSGSATSGLRNETITLTTDYEVRTPDTRSLTVQVAITRPPPPPEYVRRGDSPPPTLFYEPRPPRFAWLPCFRKKNYDDRKPPSYSALFPPAIEPERSNLSNLRSSSTSGHVPVLFENNSSFIACTPPPSYAQAQGICVAYSLEQLISNTTSDGRIWCPRSTTAVCPRCATLVLTVVDVQQATMTHVTALALFLMGCWPCCLLPYCIDSCKKSHHYCPFCRTYLGTYTP